MEVSALRRISTRRSTIAHSSNSSSDADPALCSLVGLFVGAVSSSDPAQYSSILQSTQVIICNNIYFVKDSSLMDKLLGADEPLPAPPVRTLEEEPPSIIQAVSNADSLAQPSAARARTCGHASGPSWALTSVLFCSVLSSLSFSFSPSPCYAASQRVQRVGLCVDPVGVGGGVA